MHIGTSMAAFFFFVCKITGTGKVKLVQCAKEIKNTLAQQLSEERKTSPIPPAARANDHYLISYILLP